MNKGVILSFFVLLGMMIGLAMKQPAYGVGAGFIVGIASYLLLPDRKRPKARKS